MEARQGAVNLLWDRLFDRLETPENLEQFVEEQAEVHFSAPLA